MLLMCCLVPLYLFFVKTESLRITWMPVPDVQEQINVYEELGYCSGGYITEDNKYAVIELSSWQKLKWKKHLYDDMYGFINRANEVEYMRFQLSTDVKELTVQVNRDISFETLATYFGLVAWHIELIQVVSGEEDWGFEFIIEDMDTGTVLYTALCPKDRVRVSESIWDEMDE